MKNNNDKKLYLFPQPGEKFENVKRYKLTLKPDREGTDVTKFSAIYSKQPKKTKRSRWLLFDKNAVPNKIIYRMRFDLEAGYLYYWRRQ